MKKLSDIVKVSINLIKSINNNLTEYGRTALGFHTFEIPGERNRINYIEGNSELYFNRYNKK